MLDKICLNLKNTQNIKRKKAEKEKQKKAKTDIMSKRTEEKGKPPKSEKELKKKIEQKWAAARFLPHACGR
jgi:hypothetical protein